MRLMLVAGEASGDAHGAGLLLQLNALVPHLDAFGVGGPQMLRAGLRPYFLMDELQVHGITEVIRHLPRLYQKLNLLGQAMREERPDAVLLVDYPGFNLKVARQAKQLGIPVYFFNSPQVWAWRKGRIRTIQQVVDQMLVLFPFEVELYEEAGVPVHWVGHPLLDQLLPEDEVQAFRTHHAPDPNQPLITIAPGSRPSEVRRHLDTLLASLPLLQQQVGPLQCLLPVAESLNPAELQQQVASAEVHVKLVTEPGGFQASVQASDVVLVASGTASLQTGLALTPNVVVYRVSGLTYRIAQALAQVEHIGLVNVLSKKEVVPELLQDRFTPERVAEQAARLLQDAPSRERMIASLQNVRNLLGQPGAYQRAAEFICHHLTPSA